MLYGVGVSQRTQRYRQGRYTNIAFFAAPLRSLRYSHAKQYKN